MDRFRIPRKNGIGEDVIDLRPIYSAIEALQQAAASQGGGSGGTASAQAEVSTTDAVTAHVLEPNPHPQYLLTASFTFANLGSKPTTLSGYGITDAAASSHQHSGADITSGTVADARLPTSLGAKTFTGEVVSTSANAYRIATGNYGAFWRNDGADLYLLLTASGDNLGGWNSLRPFRVTLSNGEVLFGQMTRFNVVTEVLNATGGAYVRQPRIWVGGSDPGAAASDGDLWIT